MRWMRWFRTTLLVAAALLGGAVESEAVSLKIGQPSPEITGERWINSEPLSLAKLRGRVVFVEFWTFG
jgi:heme A synthase